MASTSVTPAEIAADPTGDWRVLVYAPSTATSWRPVLNRRRPGAGHRRAAERRHHPDVDLRWRAGCVALCTHAIAACQTDVAGPHHSQLANRRAPPRATVQAVEMAIDTTDTAHPPSGRPSGLQATQGSWSTPVARVRRCGSADGRASSRRSRQHRCDCPTTPRPPDAATCRRRGQRRSVWWIWPTPTAAKRVSAPAGPLGRPAPRSASTGVISTVPAGAGRTGEVQCGRIGAAGVSPAMPRRPPGCGRVCGFRRPRSTTAHPSAPSSG
jgi:hypothetical protein